MSLVIPSNIIDLERIEEGDGIATADGMRTILAGLNTLLSRERVPIFPNSAAGGGASVILRDQSVFDFDVLSDNSTGYFNRSNLALELANSLRLAGQGAISVTASDVVVGADDTFGPLYSYYVLTPSTAADRTLSGIYTNALPSTGGQRGQVVVMVNGGSNNFTFAHNTMANPANRRLLNPGSADITIGPGGSAMFVYDIAADRWRMIAHTPQPWLSYTPAFTGSGSNPSGFDVLGSYVMIGKTVRFSARVIANAGWTDGTGAYRISLPVPAANTITIGGTWVASDVDVPTAAVGNILGASTTLADVYSIDAAPPSATVLQPGFPFTIANGDVLRWYGTYQAA